MNFDIKKLKSTNKIIFVIDDNGEKKWKEEKRKKHTNIHFLTTYRNFINYK